MHYSIYIILGLGVVLFVLPCTIRLTLENAAFRSPPRLCLDGLLGWRLLGLRLQPAAPGWRLGLLAAGWPLPFLGIALGTTSSPARPKADKKLPAKAKKASAKSSRLASFRLFYPPGLYLLRHLKGIFALRRCHISGCFGLSDPARTGQLCGWLQALRAHTGRRLRIHLDPDFTQTGLRGRLDLVVHLHLGYLLAHLLLFALRIGLGRFAQGRPGDAHSLT